MTDLELGGDIYLERGPGDRVLRAGGVELGLVVERRARAIHVIGGHEPLGRRCNHEAALPGSEVGQLRFQRMLPAADIGVEDVRPDHVSGIHEQGAGVGGIGGEVRELRAGRARRHAVGLDEREVGWLDAVRVARREGEVALEIVDVQRCAPVRVVAADVIDDRAGTWRVELHLEEGAAAAGQLRRGPREVPHRGVCVTLRSARRVWVGLRIAQRHGEPRSH